MADLTPLPPIDEPFVDERRRVTPRWRKYFMARDEAIAALQAQAAGFALSIADHEARITALEPP